MKAFVLKEFAFGGQNGCGPRTAGTRPVVYKTVRQRETRGASKVSRPAFQERTVVKSLYRRMAVVATVLFVLAITGVAQAETSIVTFPDLPSGTAWVTGLQTLFIAAAGLGLGILGLRFVVSMIAAGLARRKAR